MGNKQSNNSDKARDFNFSDQKRIWIENWKKENLDNPKVVFFTNHIFPKINPVQYTVKDFYFTYKDLHI